jgi:hypothetical protein
MPEWLALPEWLEPKLLVFFVLIGTVLFVSRQGEQRASEPVRGERRIPAVRKLVQRKSLFFGRLGFRL